MDIVPGGQELERGSRKVGQNGGVIAGQDIVGLVASDKVRGARPRMAGGKRIACNFVQIGNDAGEIAAPMEAFIVENEIAEQKKPEAFVGDEGSQ